MGVRVCNTFGFLGDTNLYSYCNGDPFDPVDKSGHFIHVFIALYDNKNEKEAGSFRSLKVEQRFGRIGFVRGNGESGKVPRIGSGILIKEDLSEEATNEKEPGQLLNDRSAMVLLALAFSNALLHALIPSHWLSFALVGRANRWSMRTALGVTALAGSGHILFTVALGLAVAGAGKELARHIPPLAEHAAAAVALILLGIYFIVRGIRQSGCQHPGHRHAGEHAHDHGGSEVSDAQPAAVGALVLGMTLSPCLDLLSLYVAAASFPWIIVGAMSVVMAATTLTLMLTLVWLTLHGLKRVKLDWLEKNEGLVVGTILMALGIYLFVAR